MAGTAMGGEATKVRMSERAHDAAAGLGAGAVIEDCVGTSASFGERRVHELLLGATAAAEDKQDDGSQELHRRARDLGVVADWRRW